MNEVTSATRMSLLNETSYKYEFHDDILSDHLFQIPYTVKNARGKREVTQPYDTLTPSFFPR